MKGVLLGVGVGVAVEAEAEAEAEAGAGAGVEAEAGGINKQINLPISFQFKDFSKMLCFSVQ